MNALEQIMRAEIATGGPMRFDRFMRQALYHPEHGFYASPRVIGKAGDFLTSVSVGPLFGRLLALQAGQMAELLGEDEFWIIEQGAHDGRLARDILEAAKEIPALKKRLRYLVVEPSEKFRAAQREMLKNELDRVHWLAALDDWRGPKPAGLFLSNELVDAFPVRLIEHAYVGWRERCVGLGPQGELTWCTTTLDAELRAALETLPLVAAGPYRTEVNLAARAWMHGVGEFLRRGYVVTIDYGFPASVYYAPFRHEGTLTCYRDHQRSGNVLEQPGGQDVTAHVDFSGLVRAGGAAGLEPLALVDQGRFLVGILQGNQEAADLAVAMPQDAAALKTLTHPHHFGGRFQVLVQAKEAPGGLHGLFFARPGGFD